MTFIFHEMIRDVPKSDMPLMLDYVMMRSAHTIIDLFGGRVSGAANADAIFDATPVRHAVILYMGGYRCLASWG